MKESLIQSQLDGEKLGTGLWSLVRNYAAYKENMIIIRVVKDSLWPCDIEH